MRTGKLQLNTKKTFKNKKHPYYNASHLDQSGHTVIPEVPFFLLCIFTAPLVQLPILFKEIRSSPHTTMENGKPMVNAD